jgi:hypothetical protein
MGECGRIRMGFGDLAWEAGTGREEGYFRARHSTKVPACGPSAVSRVRMYGSHTLYKTLGLPAPNKRRGGSRLSKTEKVHSTLDYNLEAEACLPSDFCGPSIPDAGQRAIAGITPSSLKGTGRRRGPGAKTPMGCVERACLVQTFREAGTSHPPATSLPSKRGTAWVRGPRRRLQCVSRLFKVLLHLVAHDDAALDETHTRACTPFHNGDRSGMEGILHLRRRGLRPTPGAPHRRLDLLKCEARRGWTWGGARSHGGGLKPLAARRGKASLELGGATDHGSPHSEQTLGGHFHIGAFHPAKPCTYSWTSVLPCPPGRPRTPEARRRRHGVLHVSRVSSPLVPSFPAAFHN